jgi:hypothetical protein
MRRHLEADTARFGAELDTNSAPEDGDDDAADPAAATISTQQDATESAADLASLTTGLASPPAASG